MLIAVLVVVSYVLGSLSGSLLLGRLRGVDIRTQGSGNAGGTNALRTQGWKFALGTVIVDVGKGALAAGLAAIFAAPAARESAILLCVLAAVVGHVWPVFHGFRGGKGAATLVGGLLVAWPWALPGVIGAWVLTLVITGYVGLSTVIAGASLLATAWGFGEGTPRLGFALVASLFLLYTHRGNLSRLRAGTEPRFERARIFARLFSRKTA
ncbi:glycerol-3-phosphate 1-O-acyltransferase PlsY [Arenimonas oryziterrae]|uniref:Glycerol-3-phosphate acyltransferase n=1 Tax=Arenimonas oryziterrae DSM 21050 = YC6267 TaxID=1121015 RepID=A0A091AVE9_9GAMM|nr:glycerol-3-phosphate 1-O-acyltransferase PlsY [Arenimonas oryziterrae]KFN42649.1 hypothetical protein N789_13495 [Arenimonas oryziterrae DSM 21050 = YC6267]